MRCEDCLPVIEEYFDGEVEETTAARMGAHLAACATCAAALDALSFEQEIYARYDRGGLEVTPDLWSRVSAEIAREPPPESPAAPRPFLSRVREQLAAALGTLAARPALASSLALLIVGLAVGSLWLSRRSQEQQQPAASNEMARTASPVAPAP
jgi:anti-sigma factor RsiW